MKMVLLDGALCNQMTQYVFARCLQEEFKDTNELVLLDDLWYFCDHGALGHQMQSIEHHEYQLDNFRTFTLSRAHPNILTPMYGLRL